MRIPVRAIIALPFLAGAPLSAQIVGAGTAAVGGGAAASSVTGASVGLSPRGSTGAAGRLGRPPQALGTTATLSERIDSAAGVPAPTIGARTGAYGSPGYASDGNRSAGAAVGASGALDRAGQPTGSPFAPDPVHKTVPGALDHDDDPLTPQ